MWPALKEILLGRGRKSRYRDIMKLTGITDDSFEKGEAVRFDIDKKGNILVISINTRPRLIGS